MIWKNALKYPVLITGIIMFALFLSDPKTQEYWEKQKRKYIPSNCDAIVSRSAHKADKSWSFECPGTELLIVKIPYEERDGDKFPQTRKKMYKTLANSLMTLSRITNPETMEKLKVLKVLIESDRLKIMGKTDGEAVVQYKDKKGHADFSEHLKLTVKIKEFR